MISAGVYNVSSPAMLNFFRRLASSPEKGRVASETFAEIIGSVAALYFISQWRGDSPAEKTFGEAHPRVPPPLRRPQTEIPLGSQTKDQGKRAVWEELGLA